MLRLILLEAIGSFSGGFVISFAFTKKPGVARLAGAVSGVGNRGVIQGPKSM